MSPALKSGWHAIHSSIPRVSSMSFAPWTLSAKFFKSLQVAQIKVNPRASQANCWPGTSLLSPFDFTENDGPAVGNPVTLLVHAAYQRRVSLQSPYAVSKLAWTADEVVRDLHACCSALRIPCSKQQHKKTDPLEL